MSDSDDFGGLSPTTPIIRTKRGNLARTTKPNTRTDPGPSTRRATVTTKEGRRNARDPVSDGSGAEESAVSNDPVLDDNAGPDIIRIPSRAEKPPLRAEASAVNGKQTVKRRGKAKATTSKFTRKPAVTPEPMNVDSMEDIEAEQATVDLASAINNAAGTSTKKPRSLRNDDTLTERLRRAESQVTALSQQLQEVFQVRETEAEQLLKRQEEQYEAQIQARDLLIKELSQVARKEPLTRTGKNSVLDLLTREAADEEKRAIEEETVRWKGIAEEKQITIREKDVIIAELEQTQKDLQYELKAEIERSNSLAAKPSRNPPSALRGRPGGITDDPKHAEVIRFYEDLTNLLVPNMKLQMGKTLDLEEWIFSCIFTYIDADDSSASSIRKSLHFTLRFCLTPPDEAEQPTGKDELVSSVSYVPHELDKEPPDYVEKLGFLNKPFTFAREQLPIFLRTIYTNMGDAIKEDDDNDDSIVEYVE